MVVFWMIITALCFLAWALLCWLFPAIGGLVEGLANAVMKNIRAEDSNSDSKDEGGE